MAEGPRVPTELPPAANYDKSGYYFAYDYGQNVLDTMEKDALYFPTADHATFPALYLQAVEGMRPDVTIANKYGYPEEAVYKDMPADRRRGFRKIPTDVQEQQIEDWVITHSGRPVYFTRKRGLPGVPGAKMADAGLLYRAAKESEEWKARDFWAAYKWHTLEPRDTRGDYTAELILGDYWFARGRTLLAEGKPAEAVAAFDQSLAATGETREALNNLGSACAEGGQLDPALKYFARALDLDPKYDLSLRNLAKVYLQNRDYPSALGLFERILEEQPFDPEANVLSAQCLRDMGRADDALARYRRCAELIPNDPSIWRDLGYLFEARGDANGAQHAFGRSLSLDPNQPDLALKAAQAQQAQSQDPTQALLPQIPGLDLPGMVPPMPQLPDAGLAPPVPQVPEATAAPPAPAFPNMGIPPGAPPAPAPPIPMPIQQ